MWWLTLECADPNAPAFTVHFTAFFTICCAALLIAWLLSRFFLIQVVMQTVSHSPDSPPGVVEDVQYYAIVSNGELSAARSRGQMRGFPSAQTEIPPLHRGERRWQWTILPTVSSAPTGWFGTGHGYRVYPSGISAFDSIHARLLLLFPIFAALPVIQIVREIMRRRAGKSVCRNCGYDLRATPDRCPECGTVPAKK